MARLLSFLFLNAASLASIVGLYFTVLPPNETRPAWHWMLLGAAVVIVAVLTISEFITIFRTRPKRFRSQEKIIKYMCRWVSSGGRAVIFSRDMSWAHDANVQAVLEQKARTGELTICLEKKLPLTDALERCGARIVTYNNMNFIPRARFTIVDFEREGARVAVGVHQDGHHVIQEYQSGTHPFFAVAEDLAKLLMAVDRGR